MSKLFIGVYPHVIRGAVSIYDSATPKHATDREVHSTRADPLQDICTRYLEAVEELKIQIGGEVHCVSVSVVSRFGARSMDRKAEDQSRLAYCVAGALMQEHSVAVVSVANAGSVSAAYNRPKPSNYSKPVLNSRDAGFAVMFATMYEELLNLYPDLAPW